MAYVAPPIETIELDNLRLDLENYRIPLRQSSEEDALKYLFASEDVLGSALQILRDGYFDNEVPIVVADGADYIVVEGNRRVSALKALHDPSLAPAQEKDLRALLKRYAVEAEDLPTAIRVMKVNDRATAAPHVARLHTGQSKRRWSRDQQATFYYSLLADGTTVAEVKRQYPGVEVVRFIKMAVARRFLAAVKFSDPSLSDYVTSDRLTMSAFEYAYRNKEVAKRMGLVFDAEGRLGPKTSTTEEIAGALEPGKLRTLEFVVAGFRSERLDTRAPELTKGNEGFLKELELVAGSGTRTSSPPAAGRAIRDEPEVAADGDASSGSSSRKPRDPESKDHLEMGGIDTSRSPVNLQKLYIELHTLNVRTHPVATGLLMRTILEGSIKVHFEASRPPVTGELKEVFKAVEAAYGKERKLQSVINQVRAGNGDVEGSITWFNRVAHDVDAIIEGKAVHTAWRRLSPLIRRRLQAPLANG